jgi:hypothetical protein
MIRAPISLMVVRLCSVLATHGTADGCVCYRGQHLDAQEKSPTVGEMNGIQCRLARTALGWSLANLSDAATVSTNTIKRLESDEELRPGTIARIRKAFEDAGIEFIPENGGGVGVRFREPHKK